MIPTCSVRASPAFEELSHPSINTVLRDTLVMKTFYKLPDV
jgi:hypothetical protein